MRLIIIALSVGILFPAVAPPVQAQGDVVAYEVGTDAMQCGTILKRVEEEKALQQTDGLIWKAMTLS